MNTQTSETKQKAIEKVLHLLKEGKVEIMDAFDIVMAIQETEKEFVYIPQTTPDSAPWWELNKIMCDNGLNTTSTVTKDIDSYTYAFNGAKWGPMDWIHNITIS